MADPVSMMAVGSMAASAGGGIISAISGKQGAESTAQMYQYQAGIAQLRKKIDLQNRDFALQQGGEEQVALGLKSRNVAGKILAAQGASGIDVGSDSSKRVREGQRFVSDIDLGQLSRNTARKAYGFEVEAATDEAQAGLYEKAASSTRAAIPLKMMSSLISGASSVSDKWLQGKAAGAFGGGSSGGFAFDPMSG